MSSCWEPEVKNMDLQNPEKLSVGMSQSFWGNFVTQLQLFTDRYSDHYKAEELKKYEQGP